MSRIRGHIENAPDGKFGLALIRIENYAVINEGYGNDFGGRLLQYVAERLRQGARGADVVAQAGDDLFMVFFEYSKSARTVGQWILNALQGSYEEIPLSARVGLSYTERGEAVDYDALRAAAERALDAAVLTERLVCVHLNDNLEGEQKL